MRNRKYINCNLPIKFHIIRNSKCEAGHIDIIYINKIYREYNNINIMI